MLGFSRLLRPFFSTAFIGIDVDGRNCSVYVLVHKNGKIKEEFCKEFKCVNNELPIEAAKLIRTYRNKYPFTYLGALSKTYNQGLVSTKNPKQIAKFGINVNDNKFIKLDNWSCYIQKRAIDENRVRYLKALGLDYLFSPFLLIYSLVSANLRKRNCLYVLQQQNTVSLFIADKNNVLFGGYFFLSSDLDIDNETQDDLQEIHSVFDMANIQDIIGLPSQEFEEIGELEDIDKDVLAEELLPQEFQEQKEQEAKQSHLQELKDLARANNTSDIIINCINEFYSNEIYKSDFLEKVILLDCYGISQPALQHLRSSLLLDIEIKPIELSKTIVKLMRRENKMGMRAK